MPVRVEPMQTAFETNNSLFDIDDIFRAWDEAEERTGTERDDEGGRDEAEERTVTEHNDERASLPDRSQWPRTSKELGIIARGLILDGSVDEAWQRLCTQVRPGPR